MKKIIITFLLLLSSTSLFCQAWADGIIKVRMDREDMPYRIAPISSPANVHRLSFDVLGIGCPAY